MITVFNYYLLLICDMIMHDLNHRCAP